ncbi:MAG: molecular chaperone [Gordonibacter urolithinfaciens]|uniref:TorD/DmsD family molecular chaperone n=1 Tax=Gordonibacter sp. RACS_AR68 TaxID=2872005 RepID=UPI002638930F|nr:molecular chaperone TorD family protein [Gordonibacter sp. RACS_AR68]MDN4469118.1 molecular chaperone TorD family protein [Gordonibacter sp. RACS_AR68]
MVFSRECEELAAQAEALRLLSLLFDGPSPSLLPVVESLEGLYRGDREAVELLEGMAESLERDDLVALQVDHARLFIGPFQMIAPPYASLYLEAGDRVDGEVTRRIARRYAEGGLSLLPDEKRPADYVGYLFEFLSYLAFEVVRKGGKGRFSEMDQFAEEYVLGWVPRLFGLMQEGADTRYFKSFGKLGLEHLPVGL